jgi:hypothetical protein
MRTVSSFTKTAILLSVFFSRRFPRRKITYLGGR